MHTDMTNHTTLLHIYYVQGKNQHKQSYDYRYVGTGTIETAANSPRVRGNDDPVTRE